MSDPDIGTLDSGDKFEVDKFGVQFWQGEGDFPGVVRLTPEEIEQIAGASRDLQFKIKPLSQYDAMNIIQQATSQFQGRLELLNVGKDGESYVLKLAVIGGDIYTVTTWGEWYQLMRDCH